MLTTVCFAMMLAILYQYMLENCEWVEEEQIREDYILLNPDGTLPDDRTC